VPTTLDCEVLGDLFGSSEVREVFDSRALVQAWLDVECALAKAEAAAGVIPGWAAKRIASEADAGGFDLTDLRKGVDRTLHPLVPFVGTLAERCEDAGSYVHWGATTQDVIDTGLILQIRRALEPIKRDLERSAIAAVGLARRFADTPMPGRTHGQHAVPVTFGSKAASWADELLRGVERLEDVEARVLVGQMGGAAGTLASLGNEAATVRASFCAILRLGEPRLPWHTARDRLRDLAHAIAEVSHAGERVASEIVLLQATEVAEAFEPWSEQHVGSSTMPQKQNPMLSEYIVATAQLLRASAAVLTDAPAQAHERDMRSWAAEWIAVPQMLILGGGLLQKLAVLLEGLSVDAARMLRNLGLSGGAISAEAVMMALAGELGRPRAHELVAQVVRIATDTGRDLESVLNETPEVSSLLSRAEMHRLLDPSAYLGLSTSSHEAVVAALDERRGEARAEGGPDG
jgi:3-carboxy-cis,cis-muconate cycloisomerase